MRTKSGIQEASLSERIKEVSRKDSIRAESALSNWPIQLMLLPPYAAYLNDVDLLIAADCVPFAYAAFHRDFLSEKVVLIGCPKLDDVEGYREKLENIFQQSRIRTITIVNMEVPCCFGLLRLVKEALVSSGKDIPLKQETISIKGKRLASL